VLKLVDVLLVSDERKTITNLNRQYFSLSPVNKKEDGLASVLFTINSNLTLIDWGTVVVTSCVELCEWPAA
jgi:hypothetical protein